MIWLLKNIGLITFGVCIVAAGASVEQRLEIIEAKLTKATSFEMALASQAQAIPISALKRLK